MKIKTRVIDVKSKSEANAFDSSADIVKFLRVLGLCRDARNAEGIVVAKDIRLRCAVLCLLWLVFDIQAATLRFSWTYWKEKKWRPETYYELVHSVLLRFQMVLVVLGSMSEKDKIVLRYYANLTKFDEALGLRYSEYYTRERIRLNRLFFSLSLYYFTKQVCETGLWIISFSFCDICPFFNDYLANVIQMMSQFHFFTRLNVLRGRISVLNQKIGADFKTCGEMKFDSNKNRYWEPTMNFQSCYVLLHKQHQIINRSHGLKITMSIVCHIVAVVRTTYSILIFSYSYTHGYAIAAGVVRTVPDVALLSAFVIYIASIGQLRDRLLSKLEPLQCDRTLSERERGCVLAVIELVHRQPLRFTAYDFFTLDMPLLCALLNFVLTFIVILTQIKPPADSRGYT